MVCVQTESDTSSAWKIGRYLSETRVTDTLRLNGHQGSVRQSVTVEQRVLRSTVKTTISLDAGADALAYALEIDWHEAAKAHETVPVLMFRVPLASAPDYVRVDVPAGAMDYAQKRQDVAGLTHAAAVYGERALALVTDCKYGYRAQGRQPGRDPDQHSHPSRSLPGAGHSQNPLMAAVPVRRRPKRLRKGPYASITPRPISPQPRTRVPCPPRLPCWNVAPTAR